MPPLRRSHGMLLALAALALAACNSLTGADELVLYGTNAGAGGDGDEGGEPVIDDPATTPGEGGSGGGAGSTGEPGVTTTSTTTGSTTSTTSGSPVEPEDPVNPGSCVYPSSGYGVYEGQVVPGNLAWQGYPDGSSASGTVSIKDYFDCDGSKGIHALLIVNSATWCGACQQEANDLPSHAAVFAQKGIRVLTLMVQNASGQPATLSTATSWRNNFDLQAYATAADPNFSFAGSGNVGLPLQILVDPRTMKIVDRTEGFAGYSTVTQLADKNASLGN